jgi:hypothetical protein
MDREERLAERILEVARERVGRELVTPHGDLISEEIEAAAKPGGAS